MHIWLRLLLAVIIVFGVAFGAAVWIGTIRWNSETAGMVEKLSEAPSRQGPKTVSFRNFTKLPTPVARYFHMALTDGQPLVRSARVRHLGEFLANPESKGWSVFKSTQSFSADPPGFVWDATIRMALLMDVRVRDAYLAGKGAMEAMTFTIPVMDERDKTELNAGALQRYLAEAVWFPTALLPGGGDVTWKAIDDSKALATLTDSGTTVSLEFHFNTKGEITEMSSSRYREVKGKYVLTPWVIKVWNYEERGGMRIPTEGEAAWQLPEGRQPYWKGKVVDVQYNFVK